MANHLLGVEEDCTDMGRRCCIAGCLSTSRLSEHQGVTYHSFPLDPTIRSIWVRNTRLSSDRTITKSVLVCSRHFRRVDFQPQRSGKYLLKQRIFPTVFPWGKVDAAQIEEDMELLQNITLNTTVNSAQVSTTGSASNEDETKATVEATVAQIMAEAAELSAKTNEGNTGSGDKSSADNGAGGVRFQSVTNFSPGVRLEAQDFEGIWHTARVVEVDNDDCEVLIKFEKTGKNKSAVVGSEEWIPMNSTRLRQKVSSKPIPVFELEERCMARWSGPRKFPGTVKQILDNDVYEVLFDDGYVKNVRAVHMNKMPNVAPGFKMTTEDTSGVVIDVTPSTSTTSSIDVIASAVSSPAQITASTSNAQKVSATKKRASIAGRKDWPLLDMSKLDIASLNLPEIPRDGEWTCHWVNDQPIGREGFLVVGEHRKPTVIVDDWRLPAGWIKHMYQRSNVLGKWDVILVTPNNKRFRSKADLKVYLEEQGDVYNPDIYDFSIHRRRAKDINAYVFTPDYKSSQPGGSKSPKTPIVTPVNVPEDKNNATIETSNELTAEQTKAALENSLASNLSNFLETPVASCLPPMELMTSPTKMDSMDEEEIKTDKCNLPFTEKQDDGDDKIYVYIGSLKVQIIDNLFHCPAEDCEKHFRKENHLQIHIKHYHRLLANLLGDCPKMMELAEKRTTAPDTHEPHPKNQIPNQQFFAKMHQQDLQQSRSHRRKLEADMEVPPVRANRRKITETIVAETKSKVEPMDHDQQQASKVEPKDTKKELKSLDDSMKMDTSQDENLTFSPLAPTSISNIEGENTSMVSPMNDTNVMRLSSPSKRLPVSRKSNRQRTSRNYFTPSHMNLSSNISSVDNTSFADTAAQSYDTKTEVTASRKIPHRVRKRKTASYSTPSYGSMNADTEPQSQFFPSDNAGGAVDGNNGANPRLAEIEPNLVKKFIDENGKEIKLVHMRQEEIINCLCQYGEEDGLMIQCELCLCWQHGGCNGIEKEADVPDKYVCYICRNSAKARDSMRMKHDQDWLFEGKLPTANFHAHNPESEKRSAFQKKSHTLAGNLLELKRVMYSLRVKINIASNRCHPKLYLWAKNWDEQKEMNFRRNEVVNAHDEEDNDDNGIATNASQATDGEPTEVVNNVPQPEAAIDPEECQQRLINHIKVQQSLVNKRLDDVALEIADLEAEDDMEDMKNADTKTIKYTLAYFLRQLDILKKLARNNILENAQRSAA